MPTEILNEHLRRPPALRPALLEGSWLGEAGACWRAVNPASVLEGSGDALCELPAWLERNAQQFPQGAAIGYLAYELARHFEPLNLPVNPSLPEVSFAYYPGIELFRAPPCEPCAPGGSARIYSPVDFATYGRQIQRLRDFIAAGDIYQANLTIPFRAEIGNESPESIYRRLRCSGAPFRAFLKTPQRTIVSNSPERFFCVAENRILASPIKGTMARDPHHPAQSAAALLRSEKDKAENLMIVDLLRNDLGRICNYSSVRARLWEAEALPQLVHLVSHVEGTLRPGMEIREILAALFPCGSITGAPKIRAMEILAGLEPAPRGVSMGAIGIIRSAAARDRCRMDFSVAIRTLVIEGDQAVFNVGGGIVYDSDSAAEFEEVMLKARPLFEALGAGKEVCSRPFSAIR